MCLGPPAAGAGHNGVLAESQACNCAACPPAPWCAPTKPAAPHIAELCLQRHPLQPARAHRGGLPPRVAGNHLRIEVHDQGPGIPRHCGAKSLKNSAASTKAAPTTGAQAWPGHCRTPGPPAGHEIGLRSQLGRGSVFWCACAGRPGCSATLSFHRPKFQTMPRCGSSAWVIEDDGPPAPPPGPCCKRWGCDVQTWRRRTTSH